MTENNLTPADHALLRHLKREEEHYQNAYLRTGMKHPNIYLGYLQSRSSADIF